MYGYYGGPLGKLLFAPSFVFLNIVIIQIAK